MFSRVPEYTFLTQLVIMDQKSLFLLYRRKHKQRFHIFWVQIKKEEWWRHFKQHLSSTGSCCCWCRRGFHLATELENSKNMLKKTKSNILLRRYPGQLGSVPGIEPAPRGWDPGPLATRPYHSDKDAQILSCAKNLNGRWFCFGHDDNPQQKYCNDLYIPTPSPLPLPKIAFNLYKMHNFLLFWQFLTQPPDPM